MNIVLDTNIFCEDFLMKSFRFRTLLDFAKKTESKIALPQIVYQELKAQYCRRIEKEAKIIEKSKKSLNRILVKEIDQRINLVIKDAVEKYVNFLLGEKLRVTENDIIPYKNDYLEDVVNRAVLRIKPCSEKGEEFRDALLWLTVLDIADKSKDKKTIFISKNIKEFASKNGGMHKELIKEAERRNVTIDYYKSLDDFIKTKAKPIDFITKEWLNAQINQNEINKKVVEASEQSYYQERLMRWVEEKSNNRYTRYAKFYFADVDIDDFYVYEAMDGSYYVQTCCYGEGEVEIEIQESAKGLFYESYDEIKQRSKIKCFTVSLEVIIGMDIKDKKIQEWELESISFS